MYPRMLKRKQIENEKQLKELISHVQQLYHEHDGRQIDDLMVSWLHKDGIWNLSWLDENERTAFHTISKQFMRDARAFDETLEIEEIAQAIRNVWIILILEKVCERPLCYHQAMFAYSMLYPYTDNLLDNANLTLQQKQEFNDWLNRRLQGKIIRSEHEYQQKVNDLVKMIEQHYPRECYPAVYESLLHIQNGQTASLLQYDVVDEDILLDISIAKGGASVLADGFLIDGKLSEHEYRFCIYFGFLLQLADDIQDLQQDHQNQYHTTIGVLQDKQERKSFCENYFSFIHQVMSQICPNKEQRLRKFIEENCRLLIYFSLLQDAPWYPSVFMHHIRVRLPIRANTLQELLHDFPKEKPISPKFLDEYLALS